MTLVTSAVQCSSCGTAKTDPRRDRAFADAAMDRYARGDDSAFADVYDAVAPIIYRYLVREVRDLCRAEDLLQRTLLQVHRHRASYILGSPVVPWAFAIARRLCIDEFRRNKTDALWRAGAIDESEHRASRIPEDEVASREMAALVDAQLARLPEPQRVAFALVKLDGLSHEEAAQVLGTSANAAKLRVSRACAAIRAALGRPFDADETNSETAKP
jgi:RNA polymerase sigma-70 factor (ECF subfamily)